MNNNINDIKEKGFLDIEIEESLNLVEEINKLRKEKNAVILAHFYQEAEIQDIADYIGDSLGLAQKAAETDADIILFAGVHFMAETAKILSPDKKVILPDLNAGCSLAESCKPNDFAKFIKDNPDHIVISYVNTSVGIKALTDIVCTSTNAVQIVENLPENQKIIFAPDKNLGNYINSLTGRKMLLWDGACTVHEKFSLEKILKLKGENPGARIIAHPECEKPVLTVSDFIGSTSALLNYTKNDKSNSYIVATESGILHQMRKKSPNKNFIPAPPNDSTCACNDCEYMKLNTMKKVYTCLKYELPEVNIDESIRKKALLPINKMLELSKKFKL